MGQHTTWFQVPEPFAFNFYWDLAQSPSWHVAKQKMIYTLLNVRGCGESRFTLPIEAMMPLVHFISGQDSAGCCICFSLPPRREHCWYVPRYTMCRDVLTLLLYAPSLFIVTTMVAETKKVTSNPDSSPGLQDISSFLCRWQHLNEALWASSPDAARSVER